MVELFVTLVSYRETIAWKELGKKKDLAIPLQLPRALVLNPWVLWAGGVVWGQSVG